MKQSSKDISGGVQAVICDPPYNNSQIAKLSNLEHDCLVLKDMGHFVEL